jgi:hypothetical protein
MSHLIVFAATFALDFIWALYTLAMVARDPLTSGVYAAAIILLGGIAAIGYTKNKWLLIPAVAGAFLGTVAAMRWAA